MSPRLPTPGADAGNWGSILNEFLEISHNSDGTIKNGVVSKAAIGLGSVDNTADIDKPLSNSMSSALSQKVGAYSSETGEILQNKTAKIFFDESGFPVDIVLEDV